MECPSCGLTNPEGAMRCDCGFKFVTNIINDKPLQTNIASANNVIVKDIQMPFGSMVTFMVKWAIASIPAIIIISIIMAVCFSVFTGILTGI